MNGRGLVIVGTGGGKTLIVAQFFQSVFDNNPKQKCLFVVPNLNLVSQLVSDFKDYNCTFSYQDYFNYNENTNFVVLNRQKIKKMEGNGLIVEENIQKLIEEQDVIILDEAHLASNADSVFMKALIKFRTTNHIFGLTGTLPDNKDKLFFLKGLIKEQIYTKSGDELRKEDYITNVKVKMFNIRYTDRMIYNFTDDEVKNDPGIMYRFEQSFIAKHLKRRNFIVKLLDKIKKKNVLILCDTLEQGEIIFEDIRQNITDKKVFYVSGSSSNEEKLEALEYTENHDDVIVIATTVIFAQGINLKRLHYVMLYSFSKSYTTIVQSIGRSLRKHDTKDMAVFLDINDNFRYSKEFYKKRCEFYKRENIPIDEVHFNL